MGGGGVSLPTKVVVKHQHASDHPHSDCAPSPFDAENLKQRKIKSLASDRPVSEHKSWYLNLSGLAAGAACQP